MLYELLWSFLLVNSFILTLSAVAVFSQVKEYPKYELALKVLGWYLVLNSFFSFMFLKNISLIVFQKT